MTLAIGHLSGKTAVLDCLREIRPPFSPAAVVESFSQVLHVYQCWTVRGDRWAGEWVREPLLVHGVSYEVSEFSKSEIYQAFMPMMNSRSVALLDNDRLERQLVALERRVSRGGKDSIDHSPGGHDDIANVAAGACLIALEHGVAMPTHRLQSYAVRRTRSTGDATRKTPLRWRTRSSAVGISPARAGHPLGMATSEHSKSMERTESATCPLLAQSGHCSASR